MFTLTYYTLSHTSVYSLLLMWVSFNIFSLVPDVLETLHDSCTCTSKVFKKKKSMRAKCFRNNFRRVYS